ncbi:MAG: lipopolysaccharide biosynthesis protein [Vitreimonas sp.]
MSQTLKSQAVRGFTWTAAEAAMKYGMNFAVLLVLARLLTPAEFGVAALLIPIKGLAGELIFIGLPAAVVQKKDITPSQISTVFWFQSLMAAIVAFAVGLSGPWVGAFYDHPELDLMLKATAVSMLIGATSAVPAGQLQRQLKLKVLAQINVCAVVLSGTGAIILAYLGFGPWAIVFQGILTQLFVATGVLLQRAWRPTFAFRLKELMEMLRFGGFLFGQGLLSLADQRLFGLLIVRQFGFAELGFFNRASGLATTPLNAINQITWRVAFPVFSAVQDQPDRMRRGLRELVRATIALQAPAMLGVAAVAAPAIEVLFGARWLPAAPLVPAFCIFAVASSLHPALEHALLALGRPAVLFRLGVVRSVLYVAALAIAAPFGLAALAWSLVAVSLGYLALVVFESRRLLGYGFGDFAADVGSPLCFAAAMAGTVAVLEAATVEWLPPLPRLMLGIASGALVYGLLWAAFDRPSLAALAQLVRSGRTPQREAQ